MIKTTFISSYQIYPPKGKNDLLLFQNSGHRKFTEKVIFKRLLLLS